MKHSARLITFVLALALPSASFAQSDPTDFAQLSLEQLMDLRVKSASRKEQRVADVAVAVYVITRDDIRRSGLRTLPELLRLAPGVQVSRIDSTKWAVSVRGFNSMYANKLLVLIDGRTVYNRIFSGVFWGAEDILVDDIDRIEIVRGPGSAVWGANAVNGVINVVTRTARDTEGALVSATTGSDGQVQGAARFGGSLKGIDFRVSSQWSGYDESPLGNGVRANDSATTMAHSVRGDWTRGRNAITMAGSVLTNDSHARWLTGAEFDDVPGASMWTSSDGIARTVDRHATIAWTQFRH